MMAMQQQPLRLKPKQVQVIDALNDPLVDTIVLIGTVGTGKTDIAAHAVLSIADSFSKTYWPVFRKNISTHVHTTLPSYLEMADKMGLIEGVDYRYNKSPHFFEFPNGSVIPFLEADITKDRDAKKVRGINASGNHLDEPDELDPIMFTQATSRRGRRNAYGQPSVSIISMNPSDGHLKAKYYDPWKAGTLPRNVRVIEFDISDSWQSKRDVAALMTNPDWWVQRYLYNNWDYADESLSLFKSRHWDASFVSELDAEVERTAGYDVARSANGDRSVRALGYGLVLADLAIAKDKEVQMDLPEQAQWLLRDAEENRYGLDRAAIDVVGLGVGLYDDLTREGFNPGAYMSGAKPDPDIRLDVQAYSPMVFDNLRSQMVYLYARGVELGVIKHYKGCPLLTELFKEASQHQYEIDGKVFKVESKDHVKKRLGFSPDLFDAVLMWLFMALRPMESLNLDESMNDSETFTGGLLDTTF